MAHDMLLLFPSCVFLPRPPVYTARSMTQLRRLTLLFAHGSCSKLNPKALTVGKGPDALDRWHAATCDTLRLVGQGAMCVRMCT